MTLNGGGCGTSRAIKAAALLGLATTMLNGCDVAPTPVSPRSSFNRAHELLAAMAEGDRRTRLAEYMRSGGERCGRVTRTMYRGSTAEGAAFWSVRCRPGQDWGVMIEPNQAGSTRILECSIVRATGGDCWTRFTS